MTTPPRIPDPRNIEVIGDASAEMFRAMTPAERVAFACALHRGVRETPEQFVRHEHLGWTDEAVKREVGRVMIVASGDSFIPPIVISKK